MTPSLAIPRGVTVIDAVVALSALNVVALAWHARVLHAATARPSTAR